MKKASSFVLVVAVVLLVLLSVVAVSVLVTMPPTVDPETIPSSVLEPPSPAFADEVTEGRSIARSHLAEEKLPGLSLAVAVQGEIVWAEGFRWADMELQTPVTPETVFRIGGVSQCLTAIAVGLLSQRALLDLDAPVQRSLPSFPEKEWPVSVRQLMSQTSGIQTHRGEGGLFHGSCANDADRLALFADEPLQFQPGTELSYSTYAWVLVGAVVGAIANEPTGDFVQREILIPLGMNSTMPDKMGREASDIAHFYYPRLMLNPAYGMHDAPTLDLSCFEAAVGFLSTPSDLVRLGSAMMGSVMMRDDLLDPSTIEELLTPVQLASGESTEEALGWTVLNLALGPDARPTKVVGQGLGETVRLGPLSAATTGGQVAGGTASLLLLPEHSVAIAAATNVSGAQNPSQLVRRLAAVFSGEHQTP